MVSRARRYTEEQIIAILKKAAADQPRLVNHAGGANPTGPIPRNSLLISGPIVPIRIDDVHPPGASKLIATTRGWQLWVVSAEAVG